MHTPRAAVHAELGLPEPQDAWAGEVIRLWAKVAALPRAALLRRGALPPAGPRPCLAEAGSEAALAGWLQEFFVRANYK